MNNQNILTYIATFFLVLMCVQYIPLEGYQVSYIKFGAMCLAPLIWLVYSPKISKVMMFGGLYFLAIFFSGLFNFETFRLSTVGYALSFIFMFITYYNLVYFENVFSLDYFIKLLKRIILAYAICLILQQAIHFVGISNFPLFNSMEIYDRGWLSGNSLSIEPSHSARIVAALFLCLLRMYEVKYGKENMSLSLVFENGKWAVLAFLWSMLTMGSGTAFIGLIILSMYFIKRQYILAVIPLLIILYLTIPYIDYEPLQRAKTAIEVTATLDADKIYKSDMSASARILPFIYTLDHFDITSADTWFGEGIDIGHNNDKWGLKRMIGGMTDYGFLAYIFALLLIFRCCIKNLFSLETLIFVALLMAEIRSVYVWWGVFMLFTTVRYFQEQNEANSVGINK